MHLRFFVKFYLVFLLASAVMVGLNVPNAKANEADVSINIEQEDDTVEPRDDYTYTIVVINDGSTLRNQTVRVNIDNDLDIEDFSSNGIKSGNDVTWSNLTLPANSEIRFTVDVEVNNGADDGDTYRIRAYLNNTLKDNETTDVDTDDDAELEIEMSQSLTTAKVGTNVRFEINLINDGRDNFENLEITAHLDDKFSFLTANRRGDEINDNRVKWEDIDVDNRNNTILTVNARVLQTANIGDILTIDVESENEDGDELETADAQVLIGNTTVSTNTSNSSNSSSVSSSSSSSSSSISSSSSVSSITSSQSSTTSSAPNTPVIINVTAADSRTFTIAQKTDRSETQPSSTINYNVTFINNADSALNNVKIVANTDQNTIPSTTNGGAINGNTITWNINEVQPRGIINKSYSVIVKDSVRQGDQLTSNVTATVNGVSKNSVKSVKILEQLPVTGAFTTSSALLTKTRRSSSAGRSGITVLLGALLIGITTLRRLLK